MDLNQMARDGYSQDEIRAEFERQEAPLRAAISKANAQTVAAEKQGNLAMYAVVLLVAFVIWSMVTR